MAFVNERITPEDREKYFPKYEILERYYPRDWTIDKDRESILFLRSREREDMYSDELRDKYGEYRRQVDVFIYQNCIMEIEIIRPLDFVNQFKIDKFEFNSSNCNLLRRDSAAVVDEETFGSFELSDKSPFDSLFVLSLPPLRRITR